MPGETKPTYLKREELVGKPVVAADASIIGTVEDLVATPDGKIGIRVSLKSQSDSEANTIVGPDQIQAMSDVILLKPTKNNDPIGPHPAPPPSSSSALVTRNCTRCGYANNANSRFCIKCGLRLE
jgi:sporulation protein YlmC with PRC-barrel domain